MKMILFLIFFFFLVQGQNYETNNLNGKRKQEIEEFAASLKEKHFEKFSWPTIIMEKVDVVFNEKEKAKVVDDNKKAMLQDLVKVNRELDKAAFILALKEKQPEKFSWPTIVRENVQIIYQKDEVKDKVKDEVKDKVVKEQVKNPIKKKHLKKHLKKIIVKQYKKFVSKKGKLVIHLSCGLADLKVLTKKCNQKDRTLQEIQYCIERKMRQCLQKRHCQRLRVHLKTCKSKKCKRIVRRRILRNCVDVLLINALKEAKNIRVLHHGIEINVKDTIFNKKTRRRFTWLKSPTKIPKIEPKHTIEWYRVQCRLHPNDPLLCDAKARKEAEKKKTRARSKGGKTKKGRGKKEKGKTLS